MTREAEARRIAEKQLVITIGCVFVLSSILKLFGLKDFSIVVNDFCAFLGYNILYGQGMPIAIIVCSVELLIGSAAFISRLRRWVVWVYLVVLSYFTYITYLNLTSTYGQIESCGCFGEVIHLTPSASFYKNVVLLIITIIACVLSVCKQKREKAC